VSVRHGNSRLAGNRAPYELHGTPVIARSRSGYSGQMERVEMLWITLENRGPQPFGLVRLPLLNEHAGLPQQFIDARHQDSLRFTALR